MLSFVFNSVVEQHSKFRISSVIKVPATGDNKIKEKQADFKTFITFKDSSEFNAEKLLVNSFFFCESFAQVKCSRGKHMRGVTYFTIIWYVS